MGRFDTLGSLVSAHRAWRRTLHGGCVSGGRQWAAGGPPRLVCDHFIDVLSLNHHHHHCTEGEQRGDAAILGNRVPKFPETEADEIL